MQKHKLFLAGVIITLLLLVPVFPVYAYSDSTFSHLDFIDIENVYTEIIDTEGETHTFPGFLDATYLEEYPCVEKISEYTIYSNAEEVFHVVLNDILSSNSNLFGVSKILNGYYSITFTLSEEDHLEMFLTGLTEDNVEVVQELLLEYLVTGEPIAIQSLDFIDAEKILSMPLPEAQMSWAAAASNVMQYTGWAEAYELGDCDDMMDMLVANFRNKSTLPSVGIAWLLNGALCWDYKTYSDSALSVYVLNPDAYTPAINDYAYDKLVSHTKYDTEGDPTEKLRADFDKLNAGYGVNFTVETPLKETPFSLTLWGYILDTEQPLDEKLRYKALVFSSPDSDMGMYEDRRAAINVMEVAWIFPDYQEGDYDSWLFELDGGGALLRSTETLMPFSTSLEKEENASVTRNKHTTADLVLSEIYTTVDEQKTGSAKVFTTGQEICISPEIKNLSEIDFSSDQLNMEVIVSDSAGHEVYHETTAPASFSCEFYGSQRFSSFAKVGKLALGKYNVKVTINPDMSVEEAYSYNNTMYVEEAFEVVEDPLKNASMTANVKAFEGTQAKVELSYTDPENYLEKKGNTFTLYESYLTEKDGWSSWQVAQEAQDQYLRGVTECPKQCIAEKNGTKARYMLEVTNEGIAATLTSNETELVFSKLEIAISSDSTLTSLGGLTPLSQGATSLAEGEKIGFEIKNTSTENSNLQYTVQLVARVNGEEIVLFDNEGKEETLEAGKSKVFHVSRWGENHPLYQSAPVTARATYMLDGEPVEIKVNYGRIPIIETPSCEITLNYDENDPCDGEISLREALQYAKELKEGTIDIRKFAGPDKLEVTNPLVIDAEYTIIGATEKEDGTIQCAEIFYKGEKVGTTAFIISESGNLTLDGVRLVETEGARPNPDMESSMFENNGGILNVNRCLISGMNTRKTNQSAIRLNKGVTNFNGTTITENYNSCSIIEVSEDATLNMLNCMVSHNDVGQHVLYNNGGKANIAYCTFITNDVESFSDKVIIYSEESSETNILGSVIHQSSNIEIDPNYKDMAGAVHAYGAFYGSAGEDVEVDSMSVKGNMDKICEVDEDFVIGFFNQNESANTYFLINMQEGGAKQIYLKAVNGKLQISKDKKTWKDTGVEAAFDNASYQIDILGKNHLGFYGCYAPQIVEPDPDPDPVPTGDTNFTARWIMLGGTSLIILLGAVILTLRKKRSDH